MATDKKGKRAAYKNDNFNIDVRESTLIAANALTDAFPWSQSVEGYAFWENVNDKLLDIAYSTKRGRRRVKV